MFNDIDTTEASFDDLGHNESDYTGQEVSSNSFTDGGSEYLYDSELYYDQVGLYYDGGLVSNFTDKSDAVITFDDNTLTETDLSDSGFSVISLIDVVHQESTLDDIRSYGWGFDDDQILFDSEVFLFDGDGIIESFTDESGSTITFNDNSYIATSFSN